MKQFYHCGDDSSLNKLIKNQIKRRRCYFDCSRFIIVTTSGCENLNLTVTSTNGSCGGSTVLQKSLLFEPKLLMTNRESVKSHWGVPGSRGVWCSRCLRGDSQSICGFKAVDPGLLYFLFLEVIVYEASPCVSCNSIFHTSVT